MATAKHIHYDAVRLEEYEVYPLARSECQRVRDNALPAPAELPLQLPFYPSFALLRNPSNVLERLAITAIFRPPIFTSVGHGRIELHFWVSA